MFASEYGWQSNQNNSELLIALKLSLGGEVINLVSNPDNIDNIFCAKTL